MSDLRLPSDDGDSICVRIPNTHLGMPPVWTLADALSFTVGDRASVEVRGNCFWTSYAGTPYGDQLFELLVLGIDPAAVDAVGEFSRYEVQPGRLVGSGIMHLRLFGGGLIDMSVGYRFESRAPFSDVLYSIVNRTREADHFRF